MSRISIKDINLRADAFRQQFSDRLSGQFEDDYDLSTIDLSDDGTLLCVYNYDRSGPFETQFGWNEATKSWEEIED
jgi:hypothetical protein